MLHKIHVNKFKTKNLPSSSTLSLAKTENQFPMLQKNLLNDDEMDHLENYGVMYKEKIGNLM